MFSIVLLKHIDEAFAAGWIDALVCGIMKDIVNIPGNVQSVDLLARVARRSRFYSSGAHGSVLFANPTRPVRRRKK